MYSYLMLGLALVNCAVLAWTLVQWWRHRHPVLLALAGMVLVLPYDAAVVGAGRWIGEGYLLEALSAPRIMLFHLSLPVLIPVVVVVARLAGLHWARWAGLVPAAILGAAALMVLDWQAILVMPELYPACWQDILRYLPSVPADQACRPGQAGVALGLPLPPAALAAPPLLVLTGIHLWWKRGWPWLFAGAVAAFVFLGLSSGALGPLPGFLGDTASLGALAATAVHFLRHPPPHRTMRYATL